MIIFSERKKWREEERKEDHVLIIIKKLIPVHTVLLICTLAVLLLTVTGVTAPENAVGPGTGTSVSNSNGTGTVTAPAYAVGWSVEFFFDRTEQFNRHDFRSPNPKFWRAGARRSKFSFLKNSRGLKYQYFL